MTESLTQSDVQCFRIAAEDIVREARQTILAALQGDISSRLKADGSFVTDLDLAIEQQIRRRLADQFPGHGVIGEEFAQSGDDAEFQWVIDPIDGTHSLRNGIPLFGTLLALRHAGSSVVGVIDLPILRRTYSAGFDLGATCNGRKLQLTDLQSEGDIDNEIIAIGERRQFVNIGKENVFDGLTQAHPSVRTYCDCFGHALACDGSVGAMVDFNLCIWDMAATEVLIEEAGGELVCVDTRQAPDALTRYDLIFGKPAVVEWILEKIAGELEGH